MSSAFIGDLVAGVQSTGVKPPQRTYKGDSIVNPDTLYARLAVKAQKTVTFGTPANMTSTDTTLTDTDESFAVDEWIGWIVYSHGKTMTVTGNTATVLTGASWSGGGNPGNGFAWHLFAGPTIPVFKCKIRRNGTAIQKSGDAEIEIGGTANAGSVTGLDSFTVADGDYFDVDVTLIGDEGPGEGSDLVWMVAR